MSNEEENKQNACNEGNNSTFKTGVNIIGSSHNISLPPIGEGYKRQKCPTFFEVSLPQYDPSKLSLPIPVDLSKIKKNAIISLSKVKFSLFLQNEYLSELVNALISDSFWFIIFFFRLNNKDPSLNQSQENTFNPINQRVPISKSVQITSSLKTQRHIENEQKICEILKRISCTYFKFFILVCDLGPSRKNDPVLNVFKDFMSQCVYYSIYLAFPKSRHLFNEDFRNRIVSLFAYLFNGLVSENNFVQLHWELDLGKGSIMDNAIKYKDEPMLKLPDLYELQSLIDACFNKNKYDRKVKKRKNEINQDILNSPLYRLYAETNKFETLNLIKPIKLTNRKIIDINQIAKDHANYVKFARDTLRGLAERKALYEKETAERDSEFQMKINEVKQNENRLKREFADIKIQRAQEYANYCLFLASK